jgi:hypothetical protein
VCVERTPPEMIQFSQNTAEFEYLDSSLLDSPVEKARLDMVEAKAKAREKIKLANNAYAALVGSNVRSPSSFQSELAEEWTSTPDPIVAQLRANERLAR